VKGKIFKGENLKTVQKHFTDGYWHRHFSPKEFRSIFEDRGLNVQQVDITYMARRIILGIKSCSLLDLWLKRKFGWLLFAHIFKPNNKC